MGFAERAIQACVAAMESEIVSGRHVNDIVRCKRIDVTPIEPFLKSKNEMVRKAAADIVGRKGSCSALIEAALQEEERHILFEMMRQLAQRGDALQMMESILTSEDNTIRDEAIEMFRRAGQAESLFALIFDTDEKIAQRIKRYINEQEENCQKAGAGQ